MAASSSAGSHLTSCVAKISSPCFKVSELQAWLGSLSAIPLEAGGRARKAAGLMFQSLQCVSSRLWRVSKGAWLFGQTFLGQPDFEASQQYQDGAGANHNVFYFVACTHAINLLEIWRMQFFPASHLPPHASLDGNGLEGVG